MTGFAASKKSGLRSWVPLPPGPFLSVVQLRYYFEIVLGHCRTNSAAMPMLCLYI